METTTRILQESKNPSPLNSPKSVGSNNISCSNSNGVQIHTPPLTPIPISRSTETNPYPTTFVQADTTNFKQVVQMLTGSSETAKQASSKPAVPTDPSSSSNKSSFVIPPMKTTTPKKQNFKLYERRANNFKNSLMINTLIPSFANNSGFSPRNKPEILSPSLLDFPKLALSSPVTPLNEDPFNKSSPSLGTSSSEEEKAIAEKGFYLHPSPISTPRDHEPQLLSLFPVTSPRVSGSSA
ncbi:VQ motif-containing protein 19-like [Pistacia vera]|uniref:VQ motif-containing protein 19-like n=1 Tax=Pistacia vera TaxID=55513 RepID=UPI00126328BF|nr:VQ motif-containing protein 19-like [Pistacia vera]